MVETARPVLEAMVQEVSGTRLTSRRWLGLRKVRVPHGAKTGVLGNLLRQVQDLFSALDAELSSHLMKEEQVLFPYIVAVEAHARKGHPSRKSDLGQHATRSGGWNTSTRVPGKPWRSFGKYP